MGFLEGDDVVVGCDGFDVVDDVAVASAGGCFKAALATRSTQK